VVEATDGHAGVDAETISASASAFEAAGQGFALRFGRSRADLKVLGPEARIVQHIESLSRSWRRASYDTLALCDCYISKGVVVGRCTAGYNGTEVHRPSEVVCEWSIPS